MIQQYSPKDILPSFKVGLMKLTRVLHSWSQSHITGVERHLELLIPVILPVGFIEIKKTINSLSKSYLEVPGIIITYATYPFIMG